MYSFLEGTNQALLSIIESRPPHSTENKEKNYFPKLCIENLGGGWGAAAVGGGGGAEIL